MIWFGVSLFIIGLLAVILSIVLLLRPQRRPPPTPRQMQQRQQTTQPASLMRTKAAPRRPSLESTLAHLTWARRDAQTDPHIGIVARAILVGQKGEQFPLYEGENTLGRHSSNMIQVIDSTVSRYHAVVEIFGDEFVFMDWQASQPSEINGDLVTPGERYLLKEGDKIRIGITLLRFMQNRRN